MTASRHLTLHVATYADAVSARRDFASLLDAAEGSFLSEGGAVVLSRYPDGRVDVVESADDGTTDLVIGLFAPPLLLFAARDADTRLTIGHLTKRHEEGRMGVDLSTGLPPGSSAIVSVADGVVSDRISAHLLHAGCTTQTAIDPDDYTQLKAMEVSPDEFARPERRREHSPLRPSSQPAAFA